ncbi:MAG: VTT domain-containing protein [Dehalococcoidales bacterium]|nr:VTT domain-containing protein [Dehalococcoidales bacterium]
MSEKNEVKEPETALCETQAKTRILKREIIVGVSAIVITIGLCVAAILYKDTIMNTAASLGYGLTGILLVSFLAGSILSFTAVPIPYWILVFTLPTALAANWGILAPFAVGLTSALGATLGHMPTFMIGYGGRSLPGKLSNRFSNNWYGRWYKKIITWSEKHGWIAVFINSAIFNPIHLPMTVAFGTLRYPPWKFFLYSFLGNSVKSLLLAFCGYYGLTWLLKFIGV